MRPAAGLRELCGVASTAERGTGPMRRQMLLS